MGLRDCVAVEAGIHFLDPITLGLIIHDERYNLLRTFLFVAMANATLENEMASV